MSDDFIFRSCLVHYYQFGPAAYKSYYSRETVNSNKIF